MPEEKPLRRFSDDELRFIISQHEGHCMACCIDEFCPDAVLEVAKDVQRQLLSQFESPQVDQKPVVIAIPVGRLGAKGKT